MVSRLRLLPLSLALWVLVGLGATAPVGGHGGETEIEAVPAEATGGDQVTVFGEDLEPSAIMALHLLTADGDELVGEPMTDEQGHFSFAFTLPTDLSERVYELRLTDPSGATTSTFIMVVGPETTGDAEDPGPDNRGLLMAGVLGLAGVSLLALALGAGQGRRRSS